MSIGGSIEQFVHFLIISMFYPEIPPYYDGSHNLVRLYRMDRRTFEKEIDRLEELLL